MKTRLKTESKKLKKAKAQQGKQCAVGPRCWDDVNLSLARLGEIERQMEALTARMNRRVAELKQRLPGIIREINAEQLMHEVVEVTAHAGRAHPGGLRLKIKHLAD